MCVALMAAASSSACGEVVEGSGGSSENSGTNESNSEGESAPSTSPDPTTAGPATAGTQGMTAGTTTQTSVTTAVTTETTNASATTMAVTVTDGETTASTIDPSTTTNEPTTEDPTTEDPSTSSSGGGMTTEPDTTGTTGEPFMCGDNPVPPDAACPEVCSGGCKMGGTECEIECIGDIACKDMTINCPPGFKCKVVCDGVAACDAATIQCPELYECSTTCKQTDGCKAAKINCSSGLCDLDCQAGTAVCDDLIFNCGTNDSTGQCDNPPGAITQNENADSTCACSLGNCV